MKMRTAAIGVLVLALMWLSMAALASTTLYTSPSTYGHAHYDTSTNQFTLYDDECDGDYNYVNYAFNDDGSVPSSYTTYISGTGCGGHESWTVYPSASQVVFRVCVYNTLGPDHCGSWGSTGA